MHSQCSRILPLVLFLGSALPAQTIVAAIESDKPTQPLTFKELQSRTCQKNKDHFFIIILENEQCLFTKQFAERFKEEPLADFPTPEMCVLSFGSQPYLIKELREFFLWYNGIRWACLNNRFEIITQGTLLPSAQELAQALNMDGVKSPVQRAESFLREHPGHLESVAKLCELLLLASGRRMESHLAPSPANSLTESSATQELLSPLTVEEDERIWGRTANALEMYLKNDAWEDTTMSITRYTSTAFDLARHSERMKAMVIKNMDKVTSALKSSPSHPRSWSLWIKLSGVAGGPSLLSLLDKLDPLPGTPAWPPTFVVQAYVKEAKARKDWFGIKEFLMPRWEQQRSTQEISIKTSSRDQNTETDILDAKRSMWEQFGPSTLLEALLNLGETMAAERLVMEAKDWLSVGELYGWASEIASRCGFPALAEEWASDYAKRRSYND